MRGPPPVREACLLSHLLFSRKNPGLQGHFASDSLLFASPLDDFPLRPVCIGSKDCPVPALLLMLSGESKPLMCQWQTQIGAKKSRSHVVACSTFRLPLQCVGRGCLIRLVPLSVFSALSFSVRRELTSEVRGHSSA